MDEFPGDATAEEGQPFVATFPTMPVPPDNPPQPRLRPPPALAHSINQHLHSGHEPPFPVPQPFEPGDLEIDPGTADLDDMWATSSFTAPPSSPGNAAAAACSVGTQDLCWVDSGAITTTQPQWQATPAWEGGLDAGLGAVSLHTPPWVSPSTRNTANVQRTRSVPPVPILERKQQPQPGRMVTAELESTLTLNAAAVEGSEPRKAAFVRVAQAGSMHLSLPHPIYDDDSGTENEDEDEWGWDIGIISEAVLSGWQDQCDVHPGGFYTPNEKDEHSVCTLYFLIRRLNAYEPGLVREITRIVELRGVTPSEATVNACLGKFEVVGSLTCSPHSATSLILVILLPVVFRFATPVQSSTKDGERYARRVELITRLDTRRKRGWGPYPSRVEKALRTVCGFSLAHISARKCIDPAIRTCLCMEYSYNGHVRRHRRKGCFYLAATLTTLMSLANVSLNINSAARLDLAGKSDFAVLLGLFSTFALLFLVATSLWMRSNVDLTETIFAWAVQQCGLFLLHNTMAMFCWQRTRILDFDDPLDSATFYLAVASGISAVIAMTTQTTVLHSLIEKMFFVLPCYFAIGTWMAIAFGAVRSPSADLSGATDGLVLTNLVIAQVMFLVAGGFNLLLIWEDLSVPCFCKSVCGCGTVFAVCCGTGCIAGDADAYGEGCGIACCGCLTACHSEDSWASTLDSNCYTNIREHWAPADGRKDILKQFGKVAALLAAVGLGIDCFVLHELVVDDQIDLACLLATAILVAALINFFGRIAAFRMNEKDKDMWIIDNSLCGILQSCLRWRSETFLWHWAVTESALFLIEHATSIYCWYRSGVVKTNTPMGIVCLCAKNIAGLIAASVLLLWLWQTINPSGRNFRKHVKTIVAGLTFAVLIVVNILWWTVVAYGAALEGENWRSESMDSLAVFFLSLGILQAAVGVLVAIESGLENDRCLIDWWFDALCGCQRMSGIALSNDRCGPCCAIGCGDSAARLLCCCATLEVSAGDCSTMCYCDRD